MHRRRSSGPGASLPKSCLTKAASISQISSVSSSFISRRLNTVATRSGSFDISSETPKNSLSCKASSGDASPYTRTQMIVPVVLKFILPSNSGSNSEDRCRPDRAGTSRLCFLKWSMILCLRIPISHVRSADFPLYDSRDWISPSRERFLDRIFGKAFIAKRTIASAQRKIIAVLIDPSFGIDLHGGTSRARKRYRFAGLHRRYW